MRAAFNWDKWREERYRVRLSGKKLCAIVAEGCYKITADGSELFEELGSTREEAGTRRYVRASSCFQDFGSFLSVY